jgi:hypothetical protein
MILKVLDDAPIDDVEEMNGGGIVGSQADRFPKGSGACWREIDADEDALVIHGRG